MIRIQRLAAIGLAASSAVLLCAATLLTAATSPRQDSASAAPPPAHPSLSGQYAIWQSWKLYCVECHIGPKAPAGLNLQALDIANLDVNGDTWEKLLRKLRNREMPPAGLPRPDEATYEAMVRYIETERDRASLTRPNPGRP